MNTSLLSKLHYNNGDEKCFKTMEYITHLCLFSDLLNNVVTGVILLVASLLFSVANVRHCRHLSQFKTCYSALVLLIVIKVIFVK